MSRSFACVVRGGQHIVCVFLSGLTDDDNDGVVDPGVLTAASLRDGRAAGFAPDNCQFVSNPNQINSDNDAMGDACDPGTCRAFFCACMCV
jgi:hypothetical protein